MAQQNKKQQPKQVAAKKAQPKPKSDMTLDLVLRSLNNKKAINIKDKVIKVDTSATGSDVIGSKTWGKIEFLQKQYGYSVVREKEVSE